jgi:DNA-binding NarL/FixJ family response regulator
VIRVVVADDHPAVRMSFEAFLDAQDGIEVVGSGVNGEEAVALAESREPDVVVMDVRMPVVDGIEATRQIKRLLPATRVILISAYEEPELRVSGRQAGADGFLFKGILGASLADCVRTVMAS